MKWCPTRGSLCMHTFGTHCFSRSKEKECSKSDLTKKPMSRKEHEVHRKKKTKKERRIFIAQEQLGIK